MKRTVFLALLCLTLTLLLTGCASNADTQPSPSVGMTTPMTSPNVTNMPSATNNMDGVLGSDAQQITTADDALTASKELRDAVEALGGDAGEDRSFYGDPDFEALRNL